MAVDLVEDAGFESVEATNADQAIALLERRTDVRIVFSDVYMPGSMNGVQLARVIRGRWPSIELIITSGHDEVGEDELPTRGVFFSKPCQGDEIVSTLRLMAT